MLQRFSLPPYLSERCLFHEGPVIENPKFVIHWIRGALRLDECPTFDVARIVANSLNLPLLVYQGIDERYPHASYRHHRFLMEGAADIANRAEDLGVNYILHISRKGNRKPILKDLSLEAAVVITDLMDLDPWKKWTESLSKYNSVIEVDSTCVLPRTVFGKSLDRPFRFKNATRKKFRKLVNVKWPELNTPILPLPSDWQPKFNPVDIRQELSRDGGRQILALCDIDPTVVPVTDFKGGYMAAINHWKEWCHNGLPSYHKTRNNAANRYGVSGMSPYIHYGMIAPTLIAREASEIGGKGAEKFLDELLIFREHAHHHCHKLNNPESWSNLPEWAKISWSEKFFVSTEKSPYLLEFGESGDTLWDCSQIGLFRHGVMHNNIRMTWGKAFANWIEDPEDAMKLSLNFNNKYALDGRDPNSIAGVMWCFGLFDRPFSPYNPIMGNVRKRTTEVHRNRIDFEAYSNWTKKSTLDKKLNIGIVGGGISGSFAAMLLNKLGHDVTVWDKGSQANGRLASKRVTSDFSIHVGSKSFDSLPKWMERYVSEWIRLKLLKNESDTLFPVNSLSEIISHLNEGVKVNFGCKVTNLEEKNEFVEITVKNQNNINNYQYDRVIVALPVEQANEICDSLGLKICGFSESTWVVWGPSSEVKQIPENWESYYHHSNSGAIEIRIRNDEIIGDIRLDSSSVVDYVTDKLGVSSSDWQAHHWKYAIPVEGPEEIIHTERVTIIGDAFGKPLGTVGGAIESSGRAVSDIHLRKLNYKE